MIFPRKSMSGTKTARARHEEAFFGEKLRARWFASFFLNVLIAFSQALQWK